MASVIGDHILEVVKGPGLKIVAFECSDCGWRGPTEGTILHDDWCLVGEAETLLRKLEHAEEENIQLRALLEHAENENQGLSDGCVRLRDKMVDAGAMENRFGEMMAGPEHVIDAATEYFGRRIKGNIGYMHKLEPEEVAEIIEKYGAGNITQKDLGAFYGVSQATVSMIVREQRRQNG